MASVMRMLILLALLLAPLTGLCEPQDPPDIQGYTLPIDDRPEARAWAMGIADMALLFLALSLSTYFVLKRRSRKGVFWLSLACLAYFGFIRQGCVCPIGSIQNVTDAFCNPGYAAPLVVIVFFFLPLIYSALFGRSYCASVCPHGAIQDAMCIRPMELPLWLQHGLGLLPFVYLGLAVLFAATGSAYVICDYDPFIAIFRLTGSSTSFGLAAAFLISGVFIGRPYCRFMCPYGVLLRLFSHVSRWRVEIFPNRCIDCRLCDHSCPFGAIRKTTRYDAATVQRGRRRLVYVLVLAPFLIGGLGWGCSLLATTMAKTNEWVRLSYEVEQEEIAIAGGRTLADLKRSEPSEVWRDRGEETPAQLMSRAAAIQHRFYIGSWLLGLWIGIVVVAKLVGLCRKPTRIEYEADRGDCYACGRCYEFCPGSNGVPVQFETGGHTRP